MSDDTWIKALEQQHGRETINEMRAQRGLSQVNGGEMVYVDWLKRMAGISLRPDLRVVPTGEDPDHAAD